MSPSQLTQPVAKTRALQLVGISKSFDGYRVLSDASLDVGWGEVHALLGENGAGKSTLVNTVCGLYTPDQGAMFINDEPVIIRGPTDASQHRVGMVHQHYKLVDRFTVAENVLLGCATALQLRTVAQIAPKIESAAQTLGFDIDPQSIISDLSIAEQQRVEIIKLILLGVDILILDEPTAVLTDDEAHGVLDLLRNLADQGKAIIFITHRLKEVAEFADRVTIMRGGETVVASVRVTDLSETQMARSMVGESMVPSTVDTVHCDAPKIEHTDTARLSVSGLTLLRANKRVAIDNISFQVRAGEILGLAGVGGNGQTELAESLFGLQTVSRGAIQLDGQRIDGLTITKRRQLGVRLVPADRFAYALIADLRAYENLATTDVPAGRFGSALWLRRRSMRHRAKAQFQSHNIIGGTPTTRSRLLSGGNAQKLLLARELRDGVSVLIAHSPTRGLDVRARQTVHDTILSTVAQGTACLLISEDLDEVLALSTHIGVLSRGRLHGPWQRTAADAPDRTRIGELMADRA